MVGTSRISSSFGISLNNVVEAISINFTGIVSIPQRISGYSTTSQVNAIVTNALPGYTTTANLSSKYVTNGSLSNYVTTSTLSNNSTTSQTNNLIISSIKNNQNIININFYLLLMLLIFHQLYIITKIFFKRQWLMLVLQTQD